MYVTNVTSVSFTGIYCGPLVGESRLEVETRRGSYPKSPESGTEKRNGHHRTHHGSPGVRQFTSMLLTN